MYVCMYVVVRPAINSNFAYYAIRMQSALHHYVCSMSRKEATGSLQAKVHQSKVVFILLTW